MKKWNPWSTETHYSDWYRIDKICNYTKKWNPRISLKLYNYTKKWNPRTSETLTQTGIGQTNIRNVGKESGEHRVIRTKYEDHQRRSKTNICNRMTWPTFLILQIGKNIIYIVQLSDRQTYAIIQSETLGHIEIITRTYTYLCNTTKLSIFLTNHSSRLFLVISFELLWKWEEDKG